MIVDEIEQVLSFSALQRAEIAETEVKPRLRHTSGSFSALQRAEIAESVGPDARRGEVQVSVLFNEPKLLK